MGFLGIDQGTSSTKVCRFDGPEELRIRTVRPAPQRFPSPGRIEQDPHQLLDSVLDATREALCVDGSHVVTCGLANQGETVLLYDRKSGQPLTPAISWQDSRSTNLVARLEADGLAPEIKRRTGLELHTQFPATKLPGLLAEPAAREALSNGRLGFATLDTWLIYKLCAERPQITDPSTASRTMLFNLESCQWDPWLCERFGVPMEILPEVRPSDAFAGTLVCDGYELPLHAGAVDTGAALFGQCCFRAGDAKNSFGTCSALWINLGDHSSRTDGVLDTIAWARGGRPTYAIDAEVLASGSILTWLTDRLGLASSAAELDALAGEARDDSRVIFVPALTGLGAPHWDAGASAALIGMRADTSNAEIARACFEAIAYSLGDAAAAVRAAGHRLDELRVDGGLTSSSFLMQRCADVLGAPVLVAETAEATAYGVGTLAALATGEVESLGLLSAAWRARARFDPVWSAREREARIGRWRAAVQGVRTAEYARVPGGSR